MKEATDKINQEMEENKDNSYIKYIGQYLLGYIEKNPKYAENIAKADKNIADSLKFMREKAKKVQKDGVAMFSPEEGLKIVLEYFEITEEPIAAPVLSIVKPTNKVKISLDDLL